MIRSVGVIVPAHDEQDLLPSCLASVRRAAQALRGMPVHLVVVADACRDRTVQVARRGGASVVSIDARSAGAARAAGAREVLRRTGQLDPAERLAGDDRRRHAGPRPLAAPAGAPRQPGLGRDRRHDPGGRLVRLPAGDAIAVPRAVRGRRRRRPAANRPAWPCARRQPGLPRLGLPGGGRIPRAAHGRGPRAGGGADRRGSRVLRTRALPVITSARRESRAPHGFSHYLARLEATPA